MPHPSDPFAVLEFLETTQHLSDPSAGSSVVTRLKPQESTVPFLQHRTRDGFLEHLLCDQLHLVVGCSRKEEYVNRVAVDVFGLSQQKNKESEGKVVSQAVRGPLSPSEGQKSRFEKSIKRAYLEVLN